MLSYWFVYEAKSVASQTSNKRTVFLNNNSLIVLMLSIKRICPILFTTLVSPILHMVRVEIIEKISEKKLLKTIRITLV